MDALLTALVAGFLAEWGDKTQLLVAALALRYARPAPIVAGIALAALANSLLAALGGALLHDVITLRAISFLLALSLLFAGAGGLVRAKAPDMGASWRTGPFLTAAGCFFLLEFGDKTQFITAAISAQYDAPALAAAGATAGIFAASVPAAMLGERLARTVPLRAIRLGAAALFILAGLIVAVNALRLV